MAVLIASGLRKEFSGDPLFDGVSFRLRRGDRLALAGPNGAGKTTLLRAIMGETSLQGGEQSQGQRVGIAVIAMLIQSLSFRWIYTNLLGGNPGNAIRFAGVLLGLAGVTMLWIKEPPIVRNVDEVALLPSAH